MMKRVMCVHFPAWPLQRLRHDRPELRDRSIAFYDQAAGGSRVLLYSQRDRKRGGGAACTRIRAGMALAEALAIDPRLHAEPYDAAADADHLGRLAEWAGRFSPVVACERAQWRHSLLLDITGCAACFDGEDRLLDRVVSELRDQGWTARVAIADTVGGAWGLAHYGAAPYLAPPQQTEAALRPLPIAALRLPDEAVSCLADLGIERIGELIALPRSSVPVRLGPQVIERLDQALGRLPEVLVPHRPLPVVEATFSFEYATDHRDAIHYALNRLIHRVCRALEERNAGARQVECRLHHEAARPALLDVGLYRPSRCAAHLRLLLQACFERVALQEPVCAVSLRVPVTVPLDAAQSEIFDGDVARDTGELSKLLDELSNRLGRAAVTRARLVPDAQPEHACCYAPVMDEGLAAQGDRRQRGGGPKGPARSSRISPLWAADPPTFHSRPLRLWMEPVWIPTIAAVPEGPPARFRWAGVEHSIARSWGPERIETGWWRDQDVHRDYYLVETDSGARFWVYRRLDDGRWFLHGSFE